MSADGLSLSMKERGHAWHGHLQGSNASSHCSPSPHLQLVPRAFLQALRVASGIRSLPAAPPDSTPGIVG
jgi:hypothetical protein